MEFKYNSDAFLPEETVEEVSGALVEEPVEESLAVEESKPVELPVVEKAKIKNKGKGKVVYSTKDVPFAGFYVNAGYTMVYGEDNLSKALAHPKIRLASEYEIETYFQGDK